MDFTLKKQRMLEFFNSGKTLDLKFRKDALRALKSSTKSLEKRLFDALKTDLGRSEYESFLVDVAFVYKEVDYFVKNLDFLSLPRPASSGLFLFPSHCETVPCPRGLGLIISPWNYPYLLTAMPLIGSIAAGNCSIVKPSEVSTATSEVIAEIFAKSFDENHVSVFLGGAEVTQALVDLSLDHIFFTGSPRVGKLIAQQAAKYLTPTTLELGGKSPCIIDETADIKLAAKRILWAKYINAGQTCIAPDYLLIHKSIESNFLAATKEIYERFSVKSETYSKIISQQRFDHLKSLFEDSEVILGGDIDPVQQKIGISLVRPRGGLHSPVMQEEIFGPLLPVLTYQDQGEFNDILDANPDPLAIYVFSKNSKFTNDLIRSRSCGGVCINDLMVHIAPNSLPFGGVRNSGYGQYHGNFSFETFSHLKGVMKRGGWLDPDFKYPPFPKSVPNWLRKLF